jgi:hypothetical protein
MLADGGEAIADLAVLRDQAELFGSVASDATAWRVLRGIDSERLAGLRQARAAARETCWAQTADVRGDLPISTAALLRGVQGTDHRRGDGRDLIAGCRDPVGWINHVGTTGEESPAA